MKGCSLHDELESFVKSGISPYAALRTAMVNTSRYLGTAHSKGMIEKDYDSDLIILDQNPLEDIRNTRTIQEVLKDGIWFDRKELDGFLGKEP